MKKNHSIRFLFISFFLISISIMCAVIFSTVGPKTWHALQQVQLRYIFLSFLLGLLANIFDSNRIQILCHALGYHLSFWEGLKAIFAYNFLANITPSALGGEPILIYTLTEKTDMDSQKATTIAIVRGVLLLLFIAVGGSIILFFNREYLQIPFMKILFDYVSILFLLIVGVSVYSYFFLDTVRSLLEKIIGFFQKYRLFQKYHTPQIWVKHIETWIEEFISSFKYLFQQKKSDIVYAGFFTLLSMIANYSIVYVLLKGLRYDFSFLKIVAIQIVLYFFLYLTPTPGGSGFAEGGFYLLFYNFIPKHLIGIILILWRFFIAYLWVFVGWVIIIKRFGFKGLEEIRQELSEPTNNSAI